MRTARPLDGAHTRSCRARPDVVWKPLLADVGRRSLGVFRQVADFTQTHTAHNFAINVERLPDLALGMAPEEEVERLLAKPALVGLHDVVQPSFDTFPFSPGRGLV